MTQQLTDNRMYKALLQRDASFEGLFVVGVKTTGIFCRSACRARKPKRENVEFFRSAQAALVRGYRPCKVCEPMIPMGDSPAWIKKLTDRAADNQFRLKDLEIRQLGIEPARVRRWFLQNHKMTFQAYLRSMRLGRAFGHLVEGKKVIETAFENGYDSLSGFSDAFKKKLGISPSESLNQTAISVYQLLTPLGPMLAGAVSEGICLLEFTDRRMLETNLKDLSKRYRAQIVVHDHPHFKLLREELEKYFQGKLQDFKVPLAPAGTDFQKKVWRVLQTIPYGKSRSYKEQAEAVGNPAAVRAVANANGCNKISIIIPCHRVIGSNGQLVGYGGGLERKKYLLELEQRAKT